MISVLILDDDPDILEMVSLVLISHGMKVHTLNQPSQFFDTLHKISPDIVLMDIFLGNGNDGRNICYTLKTSDEYSPVPVLLYSAAQVTDASIRNCGADDFLIKPFDIFTLINKINALTDVKQEKGNPNTR